MLGPARRFGGKIAVAILLLPLGSIPGICRAGDNPDPPKSERGSQSILDTRESSTIAAKLHQLSSHSFQQRQAAFIFLWKQGATALPSIREQITASNKQVAEACSTLELLLRLGITPDSDHELIELVRLAQGDSDSALFDLCEKGQWKLASEILAGNPQMTKILQSPYVYHQMNQLVDLAVQQKDASLAWPIVKQLLPRDEVLWLQEKQHPGAPLDDAVDADVRAKRLLFRGHVDAALELAKHPIVRLRIAICGGHWDALAETKLVDALLRNQSRTPSNQAARAALHLIAGNSDQCQSELDALYSDIGFENASASDVAIDPQASPLAISKIDPTQKDYAQFIGALILAGQGKQVLAILLEQKSEGAFAYCLARSDFAGAFRSVGLDADLGNFDAWLKEFGSSLQAELRSANPQKLDTFVRVASVLLSLGYEQQGSTILDVLIAQCRESSRVEQLRSRHQSYCWDRISLTLQTAQLRAKLLKLVAREYDHLSRECRREILGNMYPEWPQVAAALLDTAPPDALADRRRSKWELMESLWRFDREAFDPESHSVLEKWFRQALAALSTEEELNSQHADEFIALAKQLRLPELALEFASGQTTATVNWAATAELSLQRGHAQTAAEYWKAARYRDHTQHDWLFKEIAARAVSGDFETADSLERSIAYRPLLPGGLGRDDNTYRSIAAKFLEQDLLPQAREYARASMLLSPIPSSEFSLSGIVYADVLEKQKQHLASANARRAAVIPALLPNPGADRFWTYTIGRFSTILSLVQKEHVQRAIGLIEQGDIEAAEASLDIAQQLQPLGIELVEECYPGLIAAGQQSLADELLEGFAKRMREHLVRWSKDATAHNNLAWTYARCNQHLPEALAHAQIATQLAPDSPTLLDTLAEAYYRNGQIEAAITAAEKCIRLDPREPHYRQQLSRFRKKSP